MKIQSLLNPQSEFAESPHTSATSTDHSPEPMFLETPASSPGSSPRTPAYSKLLKKGLLATTRKAQVKYWPHEDEPEDEGLAAQIKNSHTQFNVQTGGRIAQSTKHIPYTSDKRTLTAKTGLEALNVFSYTFDYNGGSWGVMWDYNVGLVRITPFFKAFGYAKTQPARVLDKNQGLRDVTHSITGGSIAAQGYWMPFEAARAVCVTFCYHIRWALTPIFGYDFPPECLTPEDPDYKSFKIEKSIVRECRHRMEDLRKQTPSARSSEETDDTAAQGSSTSGTTSDDRVPSPPQQKRLRTRLTRDSKQPVTPDSDSGSEYLESQPRRSSSPVSPKTRPERSFTPINTRARNLDSPVRAQQVVQSTKLEKQTSAKTSSPNRAVHKDRYFKKRKRGSTAPQDGLSVTQEHRERSEEDLRRKAAEALLSLRGNQSWASYLAPSRTTEGQK